MLYIDTQSTKNRYSMTGFLSSLPISAYFLLAAPALRVICERNRPQDQFAAVDRTAMLQIAFVCILGLWVFYRFINNQEEFRRLSRSKPTCYFIAFLFLAGSSTLWSTYRALTFYRFFEACVYLALIIDIILTIQDFQKSILILILYCLLVFVGLFVIANRQLFISSQSITFFIRENIVGVVGAAGLFLCAPFIKLRRPRYYFIFSFFVITIILTRSSATYVAVLLTSFFILLIRPFKQLHFQTIAFMVVGAIVLAGIWLSPSMVLNRTLFFNKTPEAIKSGSGRIAIWKWYWDNAIMERPLTGYGFEAGEHQEREIRNISNAHNTFVASAVCLGFPGVFLTALLAGSMIYHAAKIPGSWGTAILAAVICAWINSLSIPSITSRVRESWIVFAFLCILITAIKSDILSTEDQT